MNKKKEAIERYFEDKNIDVFSFHKLLHFRLEKGERYILPKCNLGKDFDGKTWFKKEMLSCTEHAYSYGCHNINVYR